MKKIDLEILEREALAMERGELTAGKSTSPRKPSPTCSADRSASSANGNEIAEELNAVVPLQIAG